LLRACPECAEGTSFKFCTFIFDFLYDTAQPAANQQKSRSPDVIEGVGVLKEEDNCVDSSIYYIRRKTAQKVAFFPKNCSKIPSVGLLKQNLGYRNAAFLQRFVFLSEQNKNATRKHSPLCDA